LRRFPKIILDFAKVDWPIFMRRRAVYALADAAKQRHSTVVVVNRPLCPFTTFIRKPGRIPQLFGQPRLDKLAENLYLFSPRYFLHDHLARRLPIIEQLNLRALRKAYDWLQKKIGITEPSPLVWFYHPRQGYVTRLFPGSLHIFELCDNLASVTGREDRQAQALERALHPNVNILLTSSDKLADKYSAGYRHTWHLGNGLSREIFLKLTGEHHPGLPEILSLPAPRLGYVGLISSRLDWDLIGELANQRRNWSFVFIGSVSRGFPPRTARSLPNLHFLGARPHESMPAVLASFDLGIMPYRDNDFFKYSNPLKFYEYAAAGLRSVSSDMEYLRRFPQDFVRIVPARTPEWIAAIEDLLALDRGQARRLGAEIARQFIWEDVLEKFVEYLEKELLA